MNNTNALIKTFSSPLVTIYYLGISIAVAFIIAVVYRKTHRSVSYSQSFANSLVMLLPMVALIINIVNTNVARAIGVFGAFSVTRFRTPIKDTRDMVYIFWSLAVGLAIGAGEVGIAVTATIVLSLLAYLLYLTNFGATSNYDYTLITNLDTRQGKLEDLKRVIDKYSKAKEIINIQSDKNGENLELSSNLKLRKGIKIDELVGEINRLKGVGEVNASPSQGGIEF